MIDEKQYVINAFGSNFGAFKNKKLVIYGIGKNTSHILEHFSEHDFVGLMDEVRTGETIYGKKIIPKEKLLELGADTIVVVARASNVRIIYRRIAEFCIANAISVYDINGNLLQMGSGEERVIDQYRDVNMEALKEKIADADAVSFDIFDTLVMRKTLYPKDIFIITGDRIGETAPEKETYARIRVKAEMELYDEGKNPNIHDIYDRIQQILGLPDETKNRWKDLEIKTEEEFIVSRETMREVFDYVKAEGKAVFLVSDMYLPSSVICRLLSRQGIDIPQNRILVSCDCGVSKNSGLFNILRGEVHGNKILHIGDNREADERAARLYGIDDTFYIESAVSMLEDSYASELLQYDAAFCNRMMIGELISKELNDPFLFHTTKGKFRVDSNREMAYSFLAPMICSFIGWLAMKAKELELEHILFSARDGYLLEKVSRLLCDKIPDFPQMHYFYTSRAVAVLAGLNTDDDILHAARLAYAGLPEEMLKSRFLLGTVEILERGNISDDEYILMHREAIMKHSETARRNYLRYLDCLNIRKGSRVGFVDFVSSGTCQKGLSGFVDYDLQGLYFAQLYDEFKKDLKIESMYGRQCAYKESYFFLENYFFMENVLASFEPTLQNFNEQGVPVFLPERRTQNQLKALKDIHRAILDYAQQTKIDLSQFEKIDIALIDLIFKLLQDQYSEKITDCFETEVLEDEFCNRKLVIEPWRIR